MSGNRPVVFVVDDDPSVRRALKRSLRSMGFEVKTFASGEEFLDFSHEGLRGCLVLDVRMPGLTGLDLQEQLAECGAAVPIVFITAHQDRDVRRRAMEAGADAYLMKPFDDQVLLDAIRSALAEDASRGKDKQ